MKTYSFLQIKLIIKEEAVMEDKDCKRQITCHVELTVKYNADQVVHYLTSKNLELLDENIGNYFPLLAGPPLGSVIVATPV